MVLLQKKSVTDSQVLLRCLLLLHWLLQDHRLKAQFELELHQCPVLGDQMQSHDP